jgi:beta-barrel assembly-enhancing protease
MKVINPRSIFSTLWWGLLLNLCLLMVSFQSLAESPNPKQTQDVPSDQEGSVEVKTKEPTPEETARLAKLAIADQLYLGGDKAGAIKLYREAKPEWQLEEPQSPTPEAAFTDTARLSPAGQVFWRNYQQGKKQHLESKVLSSLKLLTTREPQFILGHIHYAQALKDYAQESEAIAALNRGVRLYPNEPAIVRAKMDADIAQDKWLDASIMARQYALFNPDAPQAAEFARLATEYLAEYQSSLRSSITWNAVGNAIVGTVGFALTGNLFGPLSALQTTSLLIQGESAVGEASVSQIKEQVPLLQDEAVTEYIDHIGQKISQVSGREEFDYQFYVVMDDNFNAFSLPGGKIFVNAGAIMQTDSEAELAGLLAHEVSHSALSHGFQLTTKGNLTANIVSYLPYVGNTASSLIVLNYSRDMEKQADLFGTRILVNAGYAADGVRNLMAKLEESQKENDPEPPEWLSSHPNSEERIAYMEKLVVEQNLNRREFDGIYLSK